MQRKKQLSKLLQKKKKSKLIKRKNIEAYSKVNPTKTQIWDSLPGSMAKGWVNQANR
jgi:hypothetical protein